MGMSQATVSQVGLTPDVMKKSLALLSLSIKEARSETQSIIDLATQQRGGPIPTAFLPSILRRYPLLSVTDDKSQFIPPIAELILLRTTAGLYYDLVPGKEPLLNDANSRFEQYCVDLVSSLTDLKTQPAHSYGPKGAGFDTPDLLASLDNNIVIVAECKATKLTYLAQFAEDPFDAEKKQCLQIARGVFQLWRYFSHVRRGIATDSVAVDAKAVVITLESFFTMASDLRTKLFEEANKLADEDGNITADDRRHVTLCPIYELEEILKAGNRERLVSALAATSEERFDGWQLREVFRVITKDQEALPLKDFPFDIDKILPWWAQLAQISGDTFAEPPVAT